jgi:hypothetical protein
VGPEHVAIIPVDCGKPEARTRVASFYGNIVIVINVVSVALSALTLSASGLVFFFVISVKNKKQGPTPYS